MNHILVKKSFYVQGMICQSCEQRIEKALYKVDGIENVEAVYSKSRVYITYNERKTKLNKILDIIEKLGYKVVYSKQSHNSKMDVINMLSILAVIFSLYILIKQTIGFNFIPKVDESMGYGLLFMVGLLTSVHCIAMCGGINISQCITYKNSHNNLYLNKLKPSFLYNAGRVLSYTIIGGVVGTLGSVVNFSGSAKGAVAIIAGLFMIIMGINMINLFPFLRKLRIRMPKIFENKIQNSNKGPFYMGLLNGFMPCGPLQTMQLYALGTGSFIKGAFSMFIFSLGTVPLMFGLGAISSLISSKFTRLMLKMSAILVIILGLIMLQRGLSLSGINISLSNLNKSNEITIDKNWGNSPQLKGKVAVISDGIQTVKINLTQRGYEPIVVQKGIPVKFIINAEESSLNGCNAAIIIPKYKIQKELNVGENIIQFTPSEEGNISYSCWMGMIQSNIQVVKKLSSTSEEEQQIDSKEEKFLEQEYIYEQEQNFNGSLENGFIELEE